MSRKTGSIRSGLKGEVEGGPGEVGNYGSTTGCTSDGISASSRLW